MLSGDRQSFEQAQVLARFRRQFDDDRDLPLREVELGDVLVVVANGGDAQHIGNRRRGDAEVGSARKIGAHDEFRADQTGRRGNGADARYGAQFAFDDAGVLRQLVTIFASQHQDVFFIGAAKPDLDLHAGQNNQRIAQLAFDVLFLDAAPFAAFCHVDRQRRLAHFGGALRSEGVAT